MKGTAVATAAVGSSDTTATGVTIAKAIYSNCSLDSIIHNANYASIVTQWLIDKCRPHLVQEQITYNAVNRNIIFSTLYNSEHDHLGENAEPVRSSSTYHSAIWRPEKNPTDN